VPPTLVSGATSAMALVCAMSGHPADVSVDVVRVGVLPPRPPRETHRGGEFVDRVSPRSGTRRCKKYKV
jgi:hypothetical protein